MFSKVWVSAWRVTLILFGSTVVNAPPTISAGLVASTIASKLGQKGEFKTKYKLTKKKAILNL